MHAESRARHGRDTEALLIRARLWGEPGGDVDDAQAPFLARFVHRNGAAAFPATASTPIAPSSPLADTAHRDVARGLNHRHAGGVTDWLSPVISVSGRRCADDRTHAVDGDAEPSATIMACATRVPLISVPGHRGASVAVQRDGGARAEARIEPEAAAEALSLIRPCGDVQWGCARAASSVCSTNRTVEGRTARDRLRPRHFAVLIGRMPSMRASRRRATRS